MALPPKDIPASALWLKLQEMPRPSKVVDFPRLDAEGKPAGQLAVWVLTQEEQMQCEAAAEELARKHLKNSKKDDLGYEAFYADAICVEVLHRACRDPEDLTRPAFPTPNLLRQRLTTEECAVLFDHYLTVQLELGPRQYQMTDEEIDAWITRIAEGGSSFPFDTMSSPVQKVLLLIMAKRLTISSKGTTSAGSQLDETPPSDDDVTEASTTTGE